MTPRTQSERSASTRARLLDATVDSLVELGWSATSTTEVARRAGVSRGAQVHHYPSKEELVLAAMEHVIALRIDEHRAAFEQLPPSRRTRTASVDILWSQCFGRSFDAWIELALAAKHSPTLHERFSHLDHVFTADVTDQFQASFPTEFADREDARVAMRLTFAVLSGIALARIAGAPESDQESTRMAFHLLADHYFDHPVDPETDPAPSRHDPEAVASPRRRENRHHPIPEER